MKKDEIIKLYNDNKTCAEISKIYKVSAGKISKLLKDNNIKIKWRSGYKKYKYNENFFSQINTEEKAYFFGLLMADGYNYEKKNRVTLSLQNKDVKILEVFKKSIGYEGPIRDAAKKTQKIIFFTSRSISKDLAKLGCVQCKSLILKFPNITGSLLNHFIRGYFDGDGCISGKKNNFQFTIISTKDFCEKLNDIFGKLIGLKKLENHPNNDITKRYRICGKKQIMKIYNFLYKDSNIYLDRKKTKMEELLCI